jgi:hypothetical protein
MSFPVESNVIVWSKNTNNFTVSIKVKSLSGINYAKSYELLMDNMFTLTYLRKQLIQVRPIWGNNLSKFDLSEETTYSSSTYPRKQLIQFWPIPSEETTYPSSTYLRKQLIQVRPFWGNNLSNFDLSEETTYPSTTYLRQQLIQVWTICKNNSLTSQRKKLVQAFQGLPKPQIYLTWLFVVKQDHQNTPNSQQFINYCPKSQVNLYMAYNIDKTST